MNFDALWICLYANIQFYKLLFLSQSPTYFLKDFVPEFWLVFHLLQYQLGYDENRFLDKPYFLVIYMV
jgi:hypothetical protein